MVGRSTMDGDWEGTYETILRKGGWFEIREREEPGRWIATTEPVQVER